MGTVKRLMGDEFQTLKHEIEVHFGRDSTHPSGDPQKPLQHADLSSVNPAKEEVTENSKSVSQPTNGIVPTTATAEETHTVKETYTTYNDSNEEGQVQLQPQVQVQERAFQILARGSKTPVVSSGSPGQYN